MILLTFDSTARVATVAVGKDGATLACSHVDAGLTQSELLLPLAEHLLASLHLNMSDVDAFVCTVGPGSFTGVRIGVATVKGLAFGSNRPCVGVTTTEALAENLRGLEGIVIAVMDARRSQVYRAFFRSTADAMERLTEDGACSLSDLAAEVAVYAKDTPVYLVGDGYDVALRALTEKGLSPETTPVLLRNQNAASLCSLGYRKILEGKTVSDRDLKPFYLRLPQAERERLERQAAKQN